MQPEIALTYSSRTGSGVAGVGWSLAATSSIYRCPRTVAQDGETRGVDFSMHDRLCLDGQRLVLVRGRYGRAGSEYRTELDRFARITLMGESMAGDASSFRVELESGRVARYGLGPLGSRNAVYVPRGARAPLAWKLQRVRDRQGNSMMYRYAKAGSGHVLREIRFAGTGVRPGERRVRFDYERTIDVGHGYRAGALRLMPLRLSEIRTYVDERTLVRGYLLEYRQSQASGRDLLARMAACASDPCQAPDRTPWTEPAYAGEGLAFAEEPIAGADGEGDEGDGVRKFNHVW